MNLQDFLDQGLVDRIEAKCLRGGPSRVIIFCLNCCPASMNALHPKFFFDSKTCKIMKSKFKYNFMSSLL